MATVDQVLSLGPPALSLMMMIEDDIDAFTMRGVLARDLDNASGMSETGKGMRLVKVARILAPLAARERGHASRLRSM